MKESHALGRRSADPHALEHLTSFADLLLVLLLCLGASGLIGIAVAAVLRRRDLAWTWALPTLLAPGIVVALIGLAAPSFEAASIALSLTTGFAAGAIAYGAHLHLEDRRAGGDREAALATRRALLDGVRRRARERGGRSAGRLEGEIPLGRTARGELACVPRGTGASGCHVLIPGATGAGKTTSLAALLVEYVVRSGFGAVVIEAKSDEALRGAAERAAAARGTPFRLVAPSGPCGYDPLARGSVDERSERLVSAQAWGSDDADFYRQASSPFLRLVLRVFDAGPEPATLASLARYCDPDELEDLALRTSVKQLIDDAGVALKGLRADERRAVAGMQARLHNLASSEFARDWLDPTRQGIHLIDLQGAIKRREVVYFRLDTDRTGNVGGAIAQMALLDLGAAASARMGEGIGTFIAIDEFGALEAPALDRLYTRGRAAGFSVAVGTQTLADLRAAGPAVAERLAATASAIVCHRIGGQSDAEWVAQLVGTVPAWETTTRTNRLGHPTEAGTRTRGYRYEVNPSELQRLAPGEALVARLGETGARRSARARVVPAWVRLAGIAAPSLTNETSHPAQKEQ